MGLILRLPGRQQNRAAGPDLEEQIIGIIAELAWRKEILIVILHFKLWFFL